ncbi:hypothetical protein RND81_06G128500 [Saponaria officinalis]|uniref:Cysteine-rich receptor-like protein kinase 10 n=1 Tax=Saponaria officinalis TaxID=3572 RepID=A0AAW1K9X9_SAPOF
MLAESLSATIQSVESGFTNGSHCATIETVLNSSMTLSNFAQCSRDLEVMQCKRCLQDAYGRFTNGYNATFLATTIFYPSCRLGYDNKPSFIGDGSLAPPPERSSDDGTNASMPPTILVIACVASFGLVFLIAGLWLYMWREPEESFEPMSISTHTSRHVAVEVVDDISNLESLQFNFEFIKTATSNFSWKNKLGRGGFGEGKFLSGEEFAAKRLSGNSKQGVLEFKNEVHLLAKLQHKNLVKLLGFCMFEDEKILIFEFLSNLSLDKYLFDPVKRASLQWEQRFRIITGIARGLLYLHEDSRLKIIHRDLKASNILLDKEMNPKIADFGLARLFDSDQTQDVTSIIAGTYGYMAPEYVLAGQFSVKSDVYSFGVIVFEIISGQKNRFLYREEDEGLLQRAWRLWNEDKTLELVDRLMENKRYSEEQVKLCIQVGLLCIQEDTTRRPTMASLISALNGRSVTLPSPNAPHLFTIGTTSDGTSSNYALLSKNRNRNGRLRYDDSEYSGTTDITELCPR